MQYLVNCKEFVTWVCFMIFSNAAFIGYISDVLIKRSIVAHYSQGVVSVGGTYEFIEVFFNIAFAVELLIRLAALEGHFCVGQEWRWNVFDAVLVSSSLVDMLLLAANMNASFIRVLRLFRVIRTLRMVRLLRFAGTFRNLQLMILAIIKSTGPLIIAVFILMMLICLFAVIILNGVSAYIEEAGSDDPNVEPMLVYFSSMPMALLTLFMSITGGVNWWEVQRLLLQIHAGYGVLFVFYISIMFLAVLNIITGIFVNDAVQMASYDHDVMVQVEQEEKLEQIKKLRHLFDRFDTNGNSTLTLAEFEFHLRDPEVQLILRMLGLEISEAPAFFKILDVDKSGDVEIDEFVMGCLHLKGKSKMMDMEVTIQDIRRMVKKLVGEHKFLNSRIDGVSDLSASRNFRTSDSRKSTPRAR